MNKPVPSFLNSEFPQPTDIYAIYENSVGTFYFPILKTVDGALFIETDNGLECAINQLELKIGNSILLSSYQRACSKEDLPALSARPGKTVPSGTVSIHNLRIHNGRAVPQQLPEESLSVEKTRLFLEANVRQRQGRRNTT